MYVCSKYVCSMYVYSMYGDTKNKVLNDAEIYRIVVSTYKVGIKTKVKSQGDIYGGIIGTMVY